MDFIVIVLVNIIKIYQFAILIRILMSWIPNSQNNWFGNFVFQITEPILGSIRRIMPNMGMIDLSPLVAFFLLRFLQNTLMGGLI